MVADISLRQRVTVSRPTCFRSTTGGVSHSLWQSCLSMNQSEVLWSFTEYIYVCLNYHDVELASTSRKCAIVHNCITCRLTSRHAKSAITRYHWSRYLKVSLQQRETFSWPTCFKSTTGGVYQSLIHSCLTMIQMAKDSWHSSKIIRADEKNAGII